MPYEKYKRYMLNDSIKKPARTFKREKAMRETLERNSNLDIMNNLEVKNYQNKVKKLIKPVIIIIFNKSFVLKGF
jgi:hypothetical protein